MEESDVKVRSLLNRVGIGLFLMVVVVFLLQNLLVMVARAINPELLNSDAILLLITGLSLVLGGIPVLYGVTKAVPDSNKGEVVKVKLIHFVGYFIICVAFMYISNFIGLIINSEIAKLKGDTQLYDPAQVILGSEEMIYTAIYAAIIAPILEEIIFRKILLEKIRRLGDVPAILNSGLAFGLFHMNLPQFFYAAVLGFFFAYITLKTNTVFYAIILHMLVNSLGVIASFFVDNVVALLIIGLLVILIIVTGLVLFFINSKKAEFTPAEKPVKKKSIYILNPGSMLFIGACLVMMIWSTVYA